MCEACRFGEHEACCAPIHEDVETGDVGLWWWCCCPTNPKVVNVDELEEAAS